MLNIEQYADLESHYIEGIARMGDMPFKVPLYTHVEGNLWQGGCPPSHLPTDVKFVVNLYPWGTYDVDTSVTYLRVMLTDSADIPNIEVMDMVADFINASKYIGKTLVHCQAGLNRSALMVAYSMMKEGTSADWAIEYLREQRSEAVLCNEHFEKWLRDWKPE